MEWSLSNVREAISIFYTPSVAPELRREAETYLEQWQRRPEGWTVGDQLLTAGLHTGNSKESFLAAQTLATKVRYDYLQLPAGSATSLRDSIITRLQADGVLPKATLRYLTLALATLVAQMEEWEDPLPSLISSLRGQTLLITLAYIPEEVSSDKVPLSAVRRSSLFQSLSRNSPIVLSFLCEVVRHSNGDIGTMEEVLGTLKAWIRWGDVSSEDLAVCPLLPFIFQCLQIEELFEAAVDTLIDILRCYTTSVHDLPLVSVMVPSILALRPSFQAVARDDMLDEEKLRGFVRLFTEMGEAYVSLLVSETYEVWHEELVSILVDCTSISDVTIARIPFTFWWSLGGGHRAGTPSAAQIATNMFGNSLMRLMSICLNMIKFPADFDKYTDDQRDDFKHYFRVDVGDVMLEICGILGCGPVLLQLAQSLQTEMSKPDGAKEWQIVEALLHALRSVARSVETSKEENIVNIMRQVLAVVPSIPPSLSNPVPVWYTSILLVGRYSDWLANNSAVDLLSPLFAFVIQGLNINEEEISSASATSLKNLCDGCSNLVASDAANLLKLYFSEGTARLPQGDQLQVIEGLSYVVSQLPLEKAVAAMESLINPHAQELANGLSLIGSKRPTKEESKRLSELFDRITTVLRYCKPSVRPLLASRVAFTHPTVDLVTKLWPIIQTTASVCKDNFSVIDKICRLYKHTLRGCEGMWSPLVEPMAQSLVVGFTSYPLSPFLYGASVLTGEVGREHDSYHDALINMYETLSYKAFEILQNLESMERQPDIVEEYFEYCVRCMDVFPIRYMRCSVVEETMKRALAGLHLQHEDGNQAVLVFLCKFFEVANKREGEVLPIVSRLMETYGESLIQQLIIALGGAIPLERIKGERTGSISNVLFNIIKFAPHAMDIFGRQLCSTDLIPDAIAPPAVKGDLISDLRRQYDNDDAVGFAIRMRDFSRLCRIAANAGKLR